MNRTPLARSPEHAQALEAYRVAEATLTRYMHDAQTFGRVRGREGLYADEEFQRLVEARDAARDAVPLADPKVQS